MLEDFEFRLRTRTRKESSEAIILSYLNSKDTLYPPKDMVMIALMSYWLPLAYQSLGKGAKENLNQNIRACIYRLKLHLQYLQEMLSSEPGDQQASLSVASTNFPQPSQLNNTAENQQCQPQVTKAQDSFLDLTSLEENEKPVETPSEKQEWFNPLKPL
jgi:hypothetical protein